MKIGEYITRRNIKRNGVLPDAKIPVFSPIRRLYEPEANIPSFQSYDLEALDRL
jgi:hypothetical protein